MRIIQLLVAVLFIGSLSAQDVTVTGFDGETHTGGSTLSKTVDFPTDLSNYSDILMHVSLSCPPGGCDPWDRFAELSVMTDEGSMEIGRYTTPYANDWCDWTIDVSDYREYLTGPTEIISHIETWSNGWNIHTSFEFIEGTPAYQHVKVTQFFKDNQFTYGDTLFYSINLPDYDFLVPSNAEEVVFRVINTGHGQGNTDNAAEFAPKTHGIHVNGSEQFEQYLWKSDCDVNPCSPQSGTWQFARAGWCPGQNVEPWDYDITSMTTPGELVNVDYVLEPFYNECSPWNPDCEPSTCFGGECTYNDNQHTTPIYKVALQMIAKSSTPLAIAENDLAEFGIEVYPNPTEDFINITAQRNVDLQLALLDITGKEVLKQNMTGHSVQLDLRAEPAGIYLLRLSSESGVRVEQIVLGK